MPNTMHPLSRRAFPTLLEIGQRIRVRRDKIGLTQEGLAKAASAIEGETVTRAAIVSYEQGRGHMPILRAASVAAALGLSVEYLLGWVDVSEARDSRSFETYYQLSEPDRAAVSAMIEALAATRAEEEVGGA